MSKGGIRYAEALEMMDDERQAVLMALQEIQGWKYLGGGKWDKPEYMKRQEAAAQQQQPKPRKRRHHPHQHQLL